jgi:hypothetical protein
MMLKRHFEYLLLMLALFPLLGHAEMTLSGFGTLGITISDQDFIYQRFIDDSGTLKNDTLGGLQLDADLTATWGLTLQTKLAPSLQRDSGFDPTLTWAFLSWRPSNDVLLRLGRLRVPLLLYSAHSDVGISFDFAHLPVEVYSISPTADTSGISINKTWFERGQEWSIEGYLGVSEADWRFYLRDGIPLNMPAGSLFTKVAMDLTTGLVFGLHERNNFWRIGVHRVDFKPDFRSLLDRYRFVPLLPNTNIGYYQNLTTPFDPNSPDNVEKAITYALTLSAEIALPYDIKLTTEYALRRVLNSPTGLDINSGYIALQKRIGHWVPYCSWSAIHSPQSRLDFYDTLNHNQVPRSIPGATIINATQRSGADLFTGYDQQSLALGTAYHLSPNRKLKLEWIYTRSDRVSSFIDAPTGEESGQRQFNLFSFSYSAAF